MLLPMSYMDALRITLSLFDEVGKDVRTFEEGGVKTFHDLVTEVQHHEAILTVATKKDYVAAGIISEDEDVPKDRKCLKRIAWSGKLIIRTSEEYLVELFRIYPGRFEKVHKRSLFAGVMLEYPNWTLSETAKKGEDPLVVITRGIKEELGLSVFNAPLTCINPGESWIDTHESSVYHDIITENHTTWFEWRMTGRHGPDTVIRRDDQVELHLKWQPYNFTLASNG